MFHIDIYVYVYVDCLCAKFKRELKSKSFMLEYYSHHELKQFLSHALGVLLITICHKIEWKRKAKSRSAGSDEFTVS